MEAPSGASIFHQEASVRRSFWGRPFGNSPQPPPAEVLLECTTDYNNGQLILAPGDRISVDNALAAKLLRTGCFKRVIVSPLISKDGG